MHVFHSSENPTKLLPYCTYPLEKCQHNPGSQETNDCTSLSPSTTYLKYSDDTVILVGLTDNKSLEYHITAAHFPQWYKDNQLHLKASKTKEIIISPLTSASDFIITSSQTVGKADSFKYSTLQWHCSIDSALTNTLTLLSVTSQTKLNTFPTWLPK